MNKISFNKELYKQQLLFEAINDYKNICEIDITDYGIKYICKFTNCKYDINRTIDEFCNYLIELMNVRK